MSNLKFWNSACRIFILWASAAIALPAQTPGTLHSFTGADGANPYAELVQSTDGNLYGTTCCGGAFSNGNIFKISPAGALTSLYSFCSRNGCPDGQYPSTGLIQGADGNFYGTTQSGGAGNYGTVFKITPAGALTVLHSFNGIADGAAPYSTLVRTANGNFIGTTNVGTPNGGGSIFKITPAGVLTTLYSFCSQSGCTDGQYSVGPLVLTSDGNLYGTTHAGGNSACFDGCGTVFKLASNGVLTTLHSFDDSDGEYPSGGLVQGLDGNFYGTTGAGGANTWGTVFQITPSGTLTTLHNFDGADGSNAYAMALGSDGNFYGVTATGGTNRAAGTLFKITPAGAFTLLLTFNGTDGKNPYGGMVQDTNGNFYGTTYFGGTAADGMVFGLPVGLAPFVAPRPAFGKVGAHIRILGTNLTGATRVTFNGVVTAFTVVSSTEIEASVPVGASTGALQVVTPSRTLVGNVPFEVLP